MSAVRSPLQALSTSATATAAGGWTARRVCGAGAARVRRGAAVCSLAHLERCHTPRSPMQYSA
jgi:hypothetical protein